MRMRVASVRLLPGISGGLAERTALVDVSVEGAPQYDAGAEDLLRSRAVAFCPDQHLYDVGEKEWPAGFLVDSAAERGAGDSWLGEWVVAVTVAAQRWGHDPVWRGRVQGAELGRLLLAIPWHRERTFLSAVEMAVKLVAQWAVPDPDRSLLRRIDREFRAGLEAVQAGGLNVDSLRFVECAARQGIPFDVAGGMVRYGWGTNAEYLDGTVTGDTGALAAIMAKHKARANRLLADAGVPVPRCHVVTNPAQAREAAAELGWPVVVKPPGLDLGLGVEPGIRDVGRLERACAAASRMGGGTVLIESHVEGLCYRLLVVHGRMLAAVRRAPAGVIGDGELSVADLIEQANTERRRATVISRLSVDGDALAYLAEQGLRLNSVPAAGRRVWLRRTAYSETGGHHENVTEDVHPDNRALAERVARLIRLDIAGIDLLTTDVTRSWREVGGAVCEVNAQPSLMPHWIAEPDRDINGEVLDILFDGRSPRIPTAVLVGSGPVAQAALLLHRIWRAAGVVSGVCTRTEVRIGDEVFDAGDFPGLSGVRAVLAEPTVGAAVFEVAGASLAESGHGCDRYQVAAVLSGDGASVGRASCDVASLGGTSVADPSSDVACMDDAVFGDVIDRTTQAVVMDVDDPRTPALLARAGGASPILLATDPAGVAGHRAGGGAAVFVADRDGRKWILLADADVEAPVISVDDLGENGPERAALAAVALAWAQGVDIGVIRAVLGSLE